MNRIHHTQRIRRLAGLLTGLVGLLAAGWTMAPAALATMVPPPGSGDNPGTSVPAQVQAAATGGMPGWQIALIAIGAALAAASIAVLLDRAWMAHRRVSARAA